MFRIFAVLLTVLLLPSGRCFYVEINLTDKNDSRNIKLLCGPPSQNFNVKSKHQVLWHGSQFGSEEQKQLRENLETEVLVPNISINSSKRHLCYILAGENAPEKKILPKKRVFRDSSASIPAENGICPPGHRMDQDRCYPCFPGSYTSGQDTECFLCPKDFYMDKKGADSCWPCPDGRKTLAQGADSEEACVYFDDAGHAVITQNPPWILIYTLIAVIIVCVWIIIIILTVRYWKEWHRDESNQVENLERRPSSTNKTTISKSKDNAYQTKSDDLDDHIYAEIGDYDDDASTYEVPRKPSDPPVYLDLEVPSLPPRRHEESRKSIKHIPIEKGSASIKISTSTDQYEIPIQPGSDHQYTEIISEPEDPIYDTVQDMSDERNDMSSDFENSRNLGKTHSMGFELTAGPITARKVQSDVKFYTANKNHKISSRQQSATIP